mgnify:CR=1 FL=1
MKSTELIGIQNKCIKKEMSVVDAVNSIDGLIGGIREVFFDNTKEGFTITNHNKIYKLNCLGYKNKKQERVYAMAAVAYTKAKENGNMFPGEVHISRKASTKHHKDGFYKLLSKYMC